MRKTMKRLVAAMCGVVTMAAPGMAWAEVPCSTYFQVKSTATGGEYVGGLLFSEGEKHLTISYNKSSTGTTTATVTSEVGTSGATVTGEAGTTTTTELAAEVVVSGTYNVGVYKMNDGSTWLVNCDTGMALLSIG